MYNNTVYNLMAQAVEESQSLWRIKNNYLKDAQDCDECMQFWEQLKDDKEQHLKDLWNLIESHIGNKKQEYYTTEEKTIA